jgi:hypothetical protein
MFPNTHTLYIKKGFGVPINNLNNVIKITAKYMHSDKSWFLK